MTAEQPVLEQRRPGLMMRDRLAREGAWLFRWRSYLPLLLGPYLAWELVGRGLLAGEAIDRAMVCAGVAIASIGEALRLYVSAHAPTGTSGRNTRRLKAFSLVTTGANSLCRNPLYLGNFLIVFGVLAVLGEVGILAVYSLAFGLYYERIIAGEEAYLLGQFGEEFRRYVAETTTFIPRLSSYRPARLKGDWKRMIRREYTTITAIVCAFAGFLTLRDACRSLALPDRLSWYHITAAAVLVVYAVMRLIKKKTRWLHRDSRPADVLADDSPAPPLLAAEDPALWASTRRGQG